MLQKKGRSRSNHAQHEGRRAASGVDLAVGDAFLFEYQLRKGDEVR